MKNNILFYCTLILLSVCSRCAENPNRVYFTINPNDSKIVFPAHLKNRAIESYFTFAILFFSSEPLRLPSFD
jgi:hypothetical protein